MCWSPGSLHPTPCPPSQGVVFATPQLVALVLGTGFRLLQCSKPRDHGELWIAGAGGPPHELMNQRACASPQPRFAKSRGKETCRDRR